MGKYAIYVNYGTRYCTFNRSLLRFHSFISAYTTDANFHENSSQRDKPSTDPERRIEVPAFRHRVTGESNDRATFNVSYFGCMLRALCFVAIVQRRISFQRSARRKVERRLSLSVEGQVIRRVADSSHCSGTYHHLYASLSQFISVRFVGRFSKCFQAVCQKCFHRIERVECVNVATRVPDVDKYGGCSAMIDYEQLYEQQRNPAENAFLRKHLFSTTTNIIYRKIPLETIRRARGTFLR